jgi:hypothetical protein
MNNKAIETLKEKLSSKDWFVGAEIDPDYKLSVVCYVSKMNTDILKEIPEKIDDENILIHFAPYKPPPPITLDDLKKENKEIKISDIDPESEIEHLILICGKGNLMIILDEIHNADEKKAMSKEFEKVASQMNALYDEFGYDILFDLVSV